MFVSSLCLQSVNISRLMVSALWSVSAQLHLGLTHWNNTHSETHSHTIHTLPPLSVRLVGGWTFDLHNSSNTHTLQHTHLSLSQQRAAGEKIWTHSEPFSPSAGNWFDQRSGDRCLQLLPARPSSSLGFITEGKDRVKGQIQPDTGHVSASAGQITSDRPEGTEEEQDEGWMRQLRFKFSQKRSVSLSRGQNY